MGFRTTIEMENKTRKIIHAISLFQMSSSINTPFLYSLGCNSLLQVLMLLIRMFDYFSTCIVKMQAIENPCFLAT